MPIPKFISYSCKRCQYLKNHHSISDVKDIDEAMKLCPKCNALMSMKYIEDDGGENDRFMAGFNKLYEDKEKLIK